MLTHVPVNLVQLKLSQPVHCRAGLLSGSAVTETKLYEENGVNVVVLVLILQLMQGKLSECSSSGVDLAAHAGKTECSSFGVDLTAHAGKTE